MHCSGSHIRSFLSTAALYALVLAPGVVFAGDAGFFPLVPDLPLIGDENLDFVGLLQGLIGISVGVAAVLAVVMVALGGVEYMMTDSPFKIGSAKDRIRDAIVGLLIVLAAVLILRTINPNLVSLDVFQGIEARRAQPLPTAAGGGGAPAAGPGATPGTPGGTFEQPAGQNQQCAPGCTWNGSACACSTDDLGPPPAPPTPAPTPAPQAAQAPLLLHLPPHPTPMRFNMHHA